MIKTNIFISGVTGKVGKILLEKSFKDESLVLCGASASSSNKIIGKDLGSLFNQQDIGINVSTIQDISPDVDVVIDFSVPESSLEILSLAQERQVAIVLGTTGFSSLQVDQIKEYSESIPLLYAPNTSIGIAMLKQILNKSEAILERPRKINIYEKHHKQKKDSPSGTAIDLRNQLKESFQENDVEITSEREGDSPGEHIVVFSFKDETVELKHKASNRTIFAEGAIKASKWIKEKPNGLYSMQDIYSS